MAAFRLPAWWLVMACLLPTAARADVTLLGEVSIPGTTKDLSGLKETLRDGTPADQLGGLGSGIAYTGKGNRYVLVSDRGPMDGNSDFPCRFHLMDIAATPGDNPTLRAKLVATKLLTDEKGKRLVGSLDAFDAKEPAKSPRFDPEAVRVGRKGTLFIADEYGPTVGEFDADGKRLRSLTIPSRFTPANPAQLPMDELPPKNTRGRQPNRGMEGLAISPDGGTLFGLMQSPLIQDGAMDKEGLKVGVNNRLLQIDVATGKTKEFVYPMDAPTSGVNEILAVNGQQFLVVERDSLVGADAKVKRIYLIDLKGATDVCGVEALPGGKLPAEIKPVGKKLFVDLLDPKFKLAGPDFPEKVEGLAFGPDLPDGRRLLLVTADNDFVSTVPFRIFAFAIDKDDLPDYEPQQFAPPR